MNKHAILGVALAIVITTTMEVGALGIQNTAIFGPEVGVVGLTLNIVFAVLLWRWLKKKSI